MGILAKAINYQDQTLAMFAEPITAARLKTLEGAKKTLKVAFQALLADLHAIDLVRLTLRPNQPGSKALRIYQQCLHTQPALVRALKDKTDHTHLSLTWESLSLHRTVILAEQKLKEAVENLTPLYQSTRMAKKQCEAVIQLAVQYGKTPEQIVENVKHEAYAKDNQTLNYRTLDRIAYWASKYQPIKPTPVPRSVLVPSDDKADLKPAGLPPAQWAVSTPSAVSHFFTETIPYYSGSAKNSFVDAASSVSHSFTTYVSTPASNAVSRVWNGAVHFTTSTVPHFFKIR